MLDLGKAACLAGRVGRGIVFGEGAVGEGLTGGVEAQGDDAAEAAFGSDGFAVEGEAFGEEVAVFGKPGVEGAGEFDGVDAVDDVVDRSVAGHGEEAGFLVALGEADGAALVLVEGGAFVPMERSDMDRSERDVPRRGTAGGRDQMALTSPAPQMRP